MLTIRKFKSFRGMEGYGFNAELLYCGKPVAFVIDEANGGCLDWQWYKDIDIKVVKDELRQSRAFLDSRNKFPTLGEASALDSAMIDIVLTHEEMQSIKRWCKTKLVWKLPTAAKGQYGTWKVPYTTEFVAKIKKDHPDAIIMNELFGRPVDEAIRKP